MRNIKIEFTKERIIPASGLAVVGAILGKSDFVKRCNRMDITKNRSQTDRSWYAWIPGMTQPKISVSFRKKAAGLSSKETCAVNAGRNGLPWCRNTVRISHIHGKGKPFTPEVETWWENTGMSDDEVIAHYHAHGEWEQFHSEIKTDMDVERLPSGKFDTNGPVPELTVPAYNILCMIGQETIGRSKTRHKVKRRRLGTVISNPVMMAGHVTSHARQLIIGLGKSNVWRHTFSEVYTAFADFRL